MLNLLISVAVAFLASSEQPDYPVIWRVARHEGGGGRIPFVADPVLLRLVEDPGFLPDWAEEVKADENGVVRHPLLKNGWAYAEYESDEERTALLEGDGFRTIFVNGEPFAGDFYSRGVLRLPIPLRRGINRFLVRVVRGRFKLRLLPAEGSCSISPRDWLLPDLREDVLLDGFGAVVILNHTDRPLKDAVIEVGDSEVFEHATVQLDPLIPYGIAKPTFPLKQLRQPGADELDEKGRYELSITLRHGRTVQTVRLPMALRKAGQPYRATKISRVDGSVQYYAVRPPLNFDPEKTYALYLTLHGAGVEATGQIGAYTPKRDGFIVAPTNRRPFGFDWQEWGRLDALETLDLFIATHRIDPRRIYLTGHSMGGHGTWYLGALYPSRFAAIGPSAGWISFFSYTGMPWASQGKLSPFKWAQLESDTMGLIENYTNLPIYVLHGEKDNNVPVIESRRMVEELERFHRDFVYHEQPGAGHWWGNQCVDWLPLFEFFRRHVNPPRPLSIRFKTFNPAISASYAWITIQSQIHPSGFSSVDADADPRSGNVRISTDNVRRLKLSLNEVIPREKAVIQIDGLELTAPTGSPAYLLKTEEGWELSDPPSPYLKGPHRSGPFKLAFDRRMVWVYGTHGSDEENAALLAKVRYDAQVWWYRGNGTVTIVPDREFDPDRFAGRNVILYGNAEINSAFDLLLKDCPIRVNRDSVRVGDRTYRGDLGVYLVYPRPDSGENLVGVIGTTSVKAIRMNFQARYFISGVAYPDYVLFSLEVLSGGMDGVVESGYFGDEWDLRM